MINKAQIPQYGFKKIQGIWALAALLFALLLTGCNSDGARVPVVPGGDQAGNLVGLKDSNSNPNMPMVFDAYLAAAEGDPSGLAMLNLITSIAPIDEQIFGDLANKAGTIDLEKYSGIKSVSLENTIMGAPMAEWIWPMAKEWPIELIPEELREFQESKVEMLLVNGSVDFSTPSTALKEAHPYFHKAQMILLPEFSHTDDVMMLQPEAFERLTTSYYETGTADETFFIYQPLSFEPGLSLATIAMLLVTVLILLPALLTLGIASLIRRFRQRHSFSKSQ